MSFRKRLAVKPLVPASKEDTLFREALKVYDSKQYKKALKLIETILKKNSNHAESIVLKGLILYFTDVKDEAKVYIEKGISKAPENPIVNHMAGIYYRAIQDYTNAAKWFKAAVDNGSTNKNILRDLSVMESQIRDYKNLKNSRQSYLEAEPGYRANWTGSAVALHLNKEYHNAENVLGKFEELAEGKLSEAEMYEHSECLLYKNSIIGESGDFERALKNLDEIEPIVKDQLSVLEYRARYLLLLGEKKKASLVYRQLLKRNPDNSSYYFLLETALGTSNYSGDVRLKLYEKLEKFYPRSDPVKFIPLTFLTGELFEMKVKDYLLSNLKRGVPSTFVNVKPLYKNRSKLKIIEKLALEFFETASSISPTNWAWSCYFLAQHYLYLKDLSKAEEFINKAVTHSPTLVELYIFKARVLKHQKKLVDAANIMNQGRELDLQDRFINSKSTKYYFRANMVDEAIETISLFTKHENSVNGVKDLHTMQANWVLIESAEAYSRIYSILKSKLASLAEPTNEEEGKVRHDLKESVDINQGLALKRYQAIVSVFKDFYNDQLEFHSYCLRRGTPRSYIDMVKWCDRLYATPIYSRVVYGASKIYFDIDNELKKRTSTEEDENDIKIKKNNKKAKKEKAKDLKRKEELIERISSVVNDNDPLGADLISTVDPLNDIFKIYKPLSVEADNRINTWIIGFELYLRQKKYILALQSINKLKKITNDHYPYIGSFVVRLQIALSEDETFAASLKKAVEKSLDASFPKLAEVGQQEFEKLYTTEKLDLLF